jgi:uroporphyrinogen decarboxylase
MSAVNFNRFVLQSPRRLALPIAVYPGLALTGARVSDIVTNPQAQFEAQAALNERYHSPFVLSAMDLSAEAEAFGCTIRLCDSEVPTVTGRLVTSLEQAQKLTVPQPGDRRTSVYLEAVHLLRQMGGRPFVFGGCIGPFSLAARLVGVSEAMELTLTDPDLMHTLLEKSTLFLTNYIKGFRAAGAHSVIMAEPAAGLLSPRGVSAFSSAYIKRIAAEVSDGAFSILLHNCAAKLLHLPAIQEAGVKAFHFGAPMDMLGALAQVPPDVVLCGNLDPSAVFVRLPPAEVSARTAQLLATTAAHRNFVLSSGCDLPPNAPLAGLDAFYQTMAGESPPPSLAVP